MSPTAPTFLIETDTFDEGNPERMGEILSERGVKWSYVKYIPFQGGLQFVKPSGRYHRLAKHYVEHNYDPGIDVVFYGSLNAAKFIQSQHAYMRPGVWMDLNKFLCQTYYVHYGRHLLGQRYAMMPVDELYKRQDFVFDTFGRDGKVFIRPDRGDKPFNGEIVSREEMDNWYECTSKYDDPQKELYKLAVVVEPVHIEAEWRLTILNGKVVTGSQYRKMVDGRSSVEIEPGCPEGVARYAEKVIKETGWTPHPIFVMDIASTNTYGWGDDGLRVIEIGAVNTCGLYACDIRKVVEAMLVASEVSQ
jgi:hypothetical protein